MKKSVLLSALALTATMFADAGITTPQARDKKVMNSKSGMQSNGLASARMNTDGDVSISVEGLLMYANLDDTLWATKNSSTEPKAKECTYYSQVVEKDKVGILPGFVVGVGVNLGQYDDWYAMLNYTWIHKTHQLPGLTDPKGYQICSLIVESKSAAREIILHTDEIRLALGRSYFNGERLSMFSSFGIRGGFQKDERTTTVMGTIDGADIPATVVANGTSVQVQKTDKRYIGPEVGFGSNWNLVSFGEAESGQFSAYGDVGIAMLFSHFNESDIMTGTHDATEADKTQVKIRELKLEDSKVYGLIPLIESKFGVRFTSEFNNQKNNILVQLGWMSRFEFNGTRSIRNNFSDPKNIIVHSIREMKSISLQGLSLQLQFGF